MSCTNPGCSLPRNSPPAERSQESPNGWEELPQISTPCTKDGDGQALAALLEGPLGAEGPEEPNPFGATTEKSQ